ncbi:hypothetical protein Bca52824_002698 [Brassica carinata]|uniref:Uncharacterized protein n=1 Tax=Brassica carinata TaxID=52824 RepID=A0A8X7WIC8_BRACI|nr:hypothetical protein Bca52824_002698 [Brassica carinata]
MNIRRDDDPVEKIPVFVSALNGAIMVPSFMAITGDMPVHFRLSMLLLVLAVLGSALSSFLSSGLRGRTWIRCVIDGILAGAAFFSTGIIPFKGQRWSGASVSMVVVIIFLYLWMKDDKKIARPGDQGKPKVEVPWLVISISFIGSIAIVFFSGYINNLRSTILRETYSCKL